MKKKKEKEALLENYLFNYKKAPSENLECKFVIVCCYIFQSLTFSLQLHFPTVTEMKTMSDLSHRNKTYLLL